MWDVTVSRHLSSDIVWAALESGHIRLVSVMIQEYTVLRITTYTR